MSYFSAEVIELPTPIDHPNADSLLLFHLTVPFEVTVIGNKESWANSTKACYVMLDSVADTSRPEFEFLGKHNRIKAKRLRGILSQGMLIPAKDEWPIGFDAKEYYGITKYEEPEVYENGPNQKSVSGPAPVGAVRYTDIEHLRRYADVLSIGEEVIITEKIDGCTSRYCWQDNKFYMGSSRRWLEDEPRTHWHHMCDKYNIKDMLMPYQNYMIAGETAGNINRIKYNQQNFFRVFDIYNIGESKYLDYDELVKFCNIMDLSMAPVIYRGPWQGMEAHYHLTEGKSAFRDGFLEGIVVRPVKERYDHRLGRVIMKLHSEKFLMM